MNENLIKVELENKGLNTWFGHNDVSSDTSNLIESLPRDVATVIRSFISPLDVIYSVAEKRPAGYGIKRIANESTFICPTATLATNSVGYRATINATVESIAPSVPMVVKGNVPSIAIKHTGEIIPTVKANNKYSLVTQNKSDFKANVLKDLLTDIPRLMDVNLTYSNLAIKIDNAGFDFNTKGISDEIKDSLNLLNFRVGTTFANQIVFVDDDSLSFLDGYIASQHYGEFTAIELQRQKGTFFTSQISAEQYKKNYQRYIASIHLPKVFSFFINEVEITLIGLEQTLLIPRSLLTTNSSTVKKTTLKILKALNQKDLSLLMKNSLEDTLDLYKDHIDPTNLRTLELLSSIPSLGVLEALASKKSSPDPDKKSNEIIRLYNMSPAYNQFNKILEENKTISSNLETLSVEIAQSLDTVHLDQREIESLNRNIEIRKGRIESTNLRINTMAEKKSKLQPRVEEIKLKTAEIKEQLINFIKNLDTASETKHQILFTYLRVQIFEAITRPIIEFDFIQKSYTVRSGKFDLTPYENMSFEQALFAILLLNSKIKSIGLTTLNAIPVFVDFAEKNITECKAVIAGPYNIDVAVTDYDEIIASVQLKDKNSKFGIKQEFTKSYFCKAHPHSQHTSVRDAGSFQNFLVSKNRMCLGEVAPLLLQAIKENNLEKIRMTVFSWISSAWSKDRWGAEWFWFQEIDNPHKKATK